MYSVDELHKYLKSKEFKKAFDDQVTADTWGKGLPKIYMKDGNIVEHWANGSINILRKKEDLGKT